MSGIVAVARRSGGVSEDGFEELLATLDYRGRDGRGRWHGDGVALGHQHHWTTPESVGQDQPVAVGGVRVALAGRLDNREALATALPRDRPLDGTTDAALLGHAYREWGDACLDRAVGAFALALRDADRERLLCARDKTGVRHLFVADADGVVVAASDAATVLAHPAVPDAPDERTLRAYLADESTADDAAFYEGVRRLPAGTRLVADTDGVRRDRYWHPADGPDLSGTSRGELRDRVRAAVREAVAARLRCRGHPGLFMSGGLDSTAVAGVAAADLGADPAAFSMVFEAVDDDRLVRDERARVRDVAGTHDLALAEVVVDDARPLGDPGAFDEPLAESPCLDPTQPATDRLARRTAADGRRVVLTGHGGNVFDGSRFAYADLLRRGRVLALLREARRDPVPTARALKWYALAPTVPSLAALVAGVDRGPPDWLGPRLRGREPAAPAAPGRFRGVHRRRSYELLTGVRRDHKLHTAHRRAARAGLALRMPLLDARVVEVAYAVPPEELLSAGECKTLFREAFADVLPASVRAVQAGRHFEAFVVDGLRRRRDYLRDLFEGSRLEARGYVADGAAVGRLQAFLDGDDDWLSTWRLFAAERWLRATGS